MSTEWKDFAYCVTGFRVDRYHLIRATEQRVVVKSPFGFEEKRRIYGLSERWFPTREDAVEFVRQKLQVTKQNLEEELARVNDRIAKGIQYREIEPQQEKLGPIAFD